MPYAQAVGNDRQLPATMTLVLQTETDAARAAAEVRRLVSSLSPNVPVAEPQTMDTLVSVSTAPSRSMMWLFVSFGGLALILAAIGTYGVVSYATAQRTFEMGVRMALGASRASVFYLVLRKSFALVLTGLSCGLAASVGLNHALTAFLYGVTATDPAALATVSILMIVVAIVAGFLPARRAATVNPSVMLRAE